MLKQRVITALILAPLAIWGILALPDPLFRLMLGLIFSMAAWEWSGLVGFARATGRGFYVGVILLGLLFANWFIGQPAWWPVGAVIVLLWWFAALLWVVRYPQGSGIWKNSAMARAKAGFLVLVPSWTCIVLLREQAGTAYLLLLMLLVWGADTGAYFAGRRWGRHKLAPRVSPGKSWEGVAGAMAVTLLLGLVAIYWLKPPFPAPLFVALCLATVAISVLGDLFESMFKRIVNIKDSGGLLPGHGGIMDRIDSLTAAAPLFTAGVLWLGA
jgi:phosphatidate cytidylyltransferase